MRSQAQESLASYGAAAFQASERGRARSLLDSLAEAKVEVREGVDAGLLERETDLKRRLNRAAERQTQLSGEDREAQDAVAKEIQNLTADYEQVRALIRTRSPKYASLTQPQPLSLSEVQQKLLDENTILLEYALGEENSYLWAVSAGSYETHRLPARAVIEKPILLLRELLTAQENRPGEATRTRRLRIQEARTRYWKEAAALSDVLLGPVAARLGRKRLLIVSDGALQYLPFAALPVPNRPPGRDPVPLIVEHELIVLPSASTLSVLRDQTSGRKKADKWVAVIADPVFEAQDPRVQKEAAAPGRGFSGSIRYPRLPSSRIEAEAIAALAPAGQALTAVGIKASRQLATSPELGQYRIVHFATHGILHSEHPELSGIVLSMFDERGKPQEGLLRLHDIYNLRLPVELVVLSACESYLGKQVRGEGLMGIVRGFMYAGASRVMASLWKVDDQATKELMVTFYRNLFEKGEPPAAALRSAQVQMSQQPDWRSPYYWAAFVLQGEWR
jgi:CHAT domain-containing protein